MKRLYRSRNRVFAGICGGVANYLDIDPVVVRVVAAISLFFTCFTTAFIYLIACIIIPEEPFNSQ